ncbi:type VII secretion protein EssA [Filibacter tadaridae]|uniref:Type VII secretion protein EssA n=1 Tax=Filibacter tadaridae TaxID=2483811 RepID=A0A3P5X0K7_9BACL|nr:type VII secretion protein EssA [Filibacter tadaridae]VDC24840.1 hypothetical protein FILTAD_01106 [Filibacter tadaridae]
MWKKIIFGTIVIVLVSLLVEENVLGAKEDDTIHDLETLLYEKLKFEKSTDYLHDEKKVEMKNTIPVKQFNIYFDGRDQLSKKGDTSFLFSTAERGARSTVAAKASELKLFIGKEEKKSVLTEGNEPVEGKSNNRTLILVLIGIIIASLILLFIIVLPKQGKGSTVEVKKTFV